MTYITVYYANSGAASYDNVFDSATAFWDTVITSGTSTTYSISSFATYDICGVLVRFGVSRLTGLSIAAQVAPIDGVGSVLGSAGPCYIDNNNVPTIGIMNFDSADIANLASSGSLEDVIIHEMGHVLGIGSLWSFLGLLNNPCTGTFSCGGNPTYNGVNGRDGYDDLGGTGALLVANTNGPGTWNAHWRESFFDNELMTGFLNSGSNPLSVMTVKSMRDLGYGVNPNNAESYSIPGFARADAVTEKEQFGDLALEFEPKLFVESEARASEPFIQSAGAIAIFSVIAVLGVIAALFTVKKVLKKQNEIVDEAETEEATEEVTRVEV